MRRSCCFLYWLALTMGMGACSNKEVPDLQEGGGTPGAQVDEATRKRFRTRSILEVQIALIKALKMKNFVNLRRFILGGDLPATCRPSRPESLWKGCLRGVDPRSLVLKEKKVQRCPGPVPARFAKGACAADRYCQSVIYTLQNRAGRRIEVHVQDLVRVNRKWWVLGPVTCSALAPAAK